MGGFVPIRGVSRSVSREAVTDVAGGDAHSGRRCGCGAPPGRPQRVRQRGLVCCRAAALPETETVQYCLGVRPWGEAGRRDAGVVWAEGVYIGVGRRGFWRGMNPVMIMIMIIDPCPSHRWGGGGEGGASAHVCVPCMHHRTAIMGTGPHRVEHRVDHDVYDG